MAKLLLRSGLWLIGTLLIGVGAYHAYQWLGAERHPDRQTAEQYLRGRLGTSTAEHEALVQQALRYDPVLAMLAVTVAQKRNESPWAALEPASLRHPSEMLRVQRQAFDLGMAEKLDRDQAVAYVDSVLGLWGILADVDEAEAAKLLDAASHLSPEECRLTAGNASYPLVAARLDAAYRADYRDHEDVLTPLLAAMPATEWNMTLASFQRAKPEVVEILQDPKLGRAFGATYMLNLDLVRDLEQAGIDRKAAIEFVAANATLIRKYAPDHKAWATAAAGLARVKAADGKTLFTWACADPTVYWLLTAAASEDQQRAIAILQRYAGTDLPAVLLKYGTEPALLAAAIDALARFDNEADADPEKRRIAGRMLGAQQDNPEFKDALARDGAILVPAMLIGGPDALAQISKNPADIHKWVDDAGKPKKTPLWTYIPGGNIAFAIREKVNGHTVTWGEMGWAALDGVLLVPIGGTVLFSAKTLLATGGRVAGESLLETSARSGAEATTEIIIGDAGGEITAETVANSSRIGAMAQAGNLLKSAGLKVVQGLSNSLRYSAQLAIKYPKTSIAISAAVLFSLFPEQTTEQGKKLAAVLRDAVGAGARTLGSVVMAVPGQTLSGMWDELQSLKAQHPMLAWIYYSLFLALAALLLVTPLILLRIFLPPVYFALMTPIRAVLGGLFRALRMTGPSRIAAEKEPLRP